jgi:hypothetical protein
MIPAVSSTFQCILDIYQACLARGEFARVILETKDGKEKVSFYSCEKGYPTPARREFQRPRKRSLLLILQEPERGEKPG